MSASPAPSQRASPASSPWGLAGLAALVATAILVFGLGEHGVWTSAELPVLDRTRAALGASASGLARSPWLPDLLRTRGYDALGGVVGLRLPHALSGVGLVALATGIARWRGASVSIALVAGALALAFPITGLTARTALGNPIGELLSAVTVLAAVVAVSVAKGRTAIVWGATAVAVGALAVSATGLAMGLCVPLATVAAFGANETRAAHQRRWLLVAGAVVAVGVTIMLSVRQGDGYVPILGAAKDLEIMDRPEVRRFVAGFEDLGYQLFPWTPLVLLGMLGSARDRLGPLWLACAVAGGAAWSVVYGTVAIPVIVPAALCGAAALERLTAPDTTALWRRAALVAVIGGVLVLGKDAELSPHRILAPFADFPGGRDFPGERLGASDVLKGLRNIAALALLGAGLLSSRHGRLGQRWLGAIPARMRQPLAVAGVVVASLSASVTLARTMVTEMSALLSPRDMLQRYQAWARAGALPSVLGSHNIRDRGLALYGPERVEALAGRQDVTAWLSAAEPRVALIRHADLAAIHMAHRHQGWPLFVLDRSHASLLLVANVLPEGAEDQNTIPDVLLDAPIPMEHETLVRFDNYVEIIGWQASDPVIRTRKASIEVLIKVLRPLPASAKLYTRLLKGRSSRMAVELQSFVGGAYPPNLWREGDYILHRYEFTAPPLEIQWGLHDLVVGIQRATTKNLEITIPEQKRGGAFGVRLRGSKRTFATIGAVRVY